MFWQAWKVMIACSVFVWVTSCRALVISPKQLYLEDVTGTASPDEIVQKWGPPQEQRKLSSGESVWVYRETLHGAYGHEECHAYELIFDDQRLQRWNDAHC
jgi:hypothetical protein